MTDKGVCPTGRFSIRFISILICGIAGCCVNRPAPTKPVYTGPTETMAQVVGQINANNSQLPSLWAHVSDYYANVIDENGKLTPVGGSDGYLLFRKPRELRFTLNKELGPVLVVGSNADLFWVSAPQQVDATWWGKYRNLGKPCVEPIPVRPDLIAEVLGISDFETNFMQSPTPMMRFNNDADAYMFTWVMPANDSPARLAAVKEVWYDRQTKLPGLVLLFDVNGRVILRAALSEHKPVAINGVPAERAPKVATHYELKFLDSGSLLRFEIEEVAVTRNKLPNTRSFQFDPATPGTTKVNQIDAKCAD